MNVEGGPRGAIVIVVAAVLLGLALAACSQLTGNHEGVAGKNTTRSELSTGYSLIFQEAEGMPKLKWILMFKEKPAEMGQLTNDLLDYYQHLSDRMQRLSTEDPVMRIDVVPMSPIQGEERKAMGADLAKDFIPLVGKTGVPFEREVLLMFYNAINEQRHLTGVMLQLETDPALRKFLEATKNQLDARYAKVASLLNRRYFIQ